MGIFLLFLTIVFFFAILLVHTVDTLFYNQTNSRELDITDLDQNTEIGSIYFSASSRQIKQK